MTVGGEVKGIGFAVGPSLAITARHVIRDALDPEGRQRPDCAVQLLTEDGVSCDVDIGMCNNPFDVASLVLRQSVERWLQPAAPADGAKWRVQSRPRDDDPVLSGHITACSRPLATELGDEVLLVQLHVEEDLGDYSGYSGSPVEIDGTAPDRRLIGVLIEQARWRTKNPDQKRPNVANVLYAVPITTVLQILGIQERPPDDPEFAVFLVRMRKINKVEHEADSDLVRELRKEVMYRYVFGE